MLYTVPGARSTHGNAETMDDDSDGGTGLPASLEAAWGLRARPSKGPRRGLSLEQIVEAAVKIATSDGLEAVSMGRVAGDLGVSTMSLYRYVAAKDELLALMVDATAASPPAAPAPGEGWRAGLSRWARAELDIYRRHPWVLRVPISGPPVAPNQIAWLEQGLRCLRDTGLAEGEKLSVMLLLTGFVRSWGRLEADLMEASMASGASAQAAMSGYGRLLARLTDAERFPALHAVIAAGVFDQGPDDPDEPDEFVFGLERVLDGIGALVRARAGTRP
jgi:AcrR family transcriptional regulator